MEKFNGLNWKEIAKKIELLTVFATMAVGIIGCSNYAKAPSYSECVTLGGTDQQCLEIFDPSALLALKELSRIKIENLREEEKQADAMQTQATTTALEKQRVEGTNAAPRYASASVEPGEGILAVLSRINPNFDPHGPMGLSQIVIVISNGKASLFTVIELVESAPNDPKYRVNPGDCVITAPDQYGIDLGIRENQDSCPVY